MLNSNLLKCKMSIYSFVTSTSAKLFQCQTSKISEFKFPGGMFIINENVWYKKTKLMSYRNCRTTVTSDFRWILLYLGDNARK